MACLHEAIVAAIGRAIDRGDRMRDRSPRRSHRVNIHAIVSVLHLIWRQCWPKLHFFAENFRRCTQFEYNSHGYTYIHCVYAISNIMYNISCVIKSANSGYYGQPDRPTPAARQQASDKTIWSVWESVHSPYRRHCLCRISLVGDWLKFA